MKKIEAYIQPHKMDEIIDVLKGLELNGMSISQIMGVGKQMGWKEHVRGAEIDYNFLPKIKIEIITVNEKVDMIVEKIISVARTGDIGDGKIFVYDVENAIRVRTGETGDHAVL